MHNSGQLSVAGHAQAPFADWRVLGVVQRDCGVVLPRKMFADAGAEVVKIESPQGDSVRSLDRRRPAGALFGYLAANKKSVIFE